MSMTQAYITLETLEREMDLKNLTPDVDMTLRRITIPEINRPALQLTGFFNHFENERVQIIGASFTFIHRMISAVNADVLFSEEKVAT